MDTHPSLPPELWERTPPAIRAHIEMLEGQVQTVTSMVHTFQEQVRTLEERRNQTSRNSSRPPSSDPPQHHRPRRPPGQRRRGGQPGPPGHTRPLVPVEEVDAVVVLKPTQCRRCQAPLSGDEASPFRHQVLEMPPIQPVITEYQWHQVTCPACGATMRAPWPAGVPRGTYGPRVHATVALCTGSYRLSKRTTRQVMDDLFGVPMSASTISQSEQATTAVVAEPVEEARAAVQEGLDHGMGHLASMRPENNERLPPIKVETMGRPRHPEPSPYTGEGWTKEVAVGTVIQDPQQLTPAGQPRWDRCERADLFAQYRELRLQGISERQAAKERKGPRTTLQAWRLWHDTRESCPHVAHVLQSGPGLAFVHRRVMAFHLVCVEVGACGMRLGCRCLKLTGLNRLVAAAYGAQQQGNVQVAQALVTLWPR